MNKQVLRKLIRESFDDNNNLYVTKVDVDALIDTGIGEDDYFTDDSKATIYWNTGFVKNSYGITDIYPIIKKIELNLELWREEEQEYETVKKVYDNLNVTDGSNIGEYKVKIDRNSETNNMFPTHITIYEEMKYIDISFDMP